MKCIFKINWVMYSLVTFRCSFIVILDITSRTHICEKGSTDTRNPFILTMWLFSFWLNDFWTAKPSLAQWKQQHKTSSLSVLMFYFFPHLCMKVRCIIVIKIMKLLENRSTHYVVKLERSDSELHFFSNENLKKSY